MIAACAGFGANTPYGAGEASLSGVKGKASSVKAAVAGACITGFVWNSNAPRGIVGARFLSLLALRGIALCDRIEDVAIPDIDAVSEADRADDRGLYAPNTRKPARGKCTTTSPACG